LSYQFGTIKTIYQYEHQKEEILKGKKHLNYYLIMKGHKQHFEIDFNNRMFLRIFFFDLNDKIHLDKKKWVKVKCFKLSYNFLNLCSNNKWDMGKRQIQTSKFYHVKRGNEKRFDFIPQLNFVEKLLVPIRVIYYFAFSLILKVMSSRKINRINICIAKGTSP